MGASQGDKTMKNGTENQKGIIVTDNAGTVHGYARCSTNETRQARYGSCGLLVQPGYGESTSMGTLRLKSNRT